MTSSLTAGTRREYAERSLLWTGPSTRSEDEYLQRIWNLANDVIVLEEALTRALEELGREQVANSLLRRHLGAIKETAIAGLEGG